MEQGINMEALEILWTDMAWRSELAKLRRPAVLGSLATEALLNAGWSYSVEVQHLDLFSIYRCAMEKVQQMLEPTQSGKLTDGLYFYRKDEFAQDLAQMHQFIDEHGL